MADPFQVVLASASPRRSELLSAAGVPFTVRASQVDEVLEPEVAADPEQAAQTLAEQKAGVVVQEILAEQPAGIFLVIGADTMVVLEGEIFGKPQNYSHGVHMLRTLSGRTHQVITGVSAWVIAAEDPEKVSVGKRNFAEVSDVTFRDLTDDEIADYLHQGESYDKAGAYAAQGKGAALIERIDGDLDNVIGLPVTRLLKEFPELAELGK